MRLCKAKNDARASGASLMDLLGTVFSHVIVVCYDGNHVSCLPIVPIAASDPPASFIWAASLPCMFSAVRSTRASLEDARTTTEALPRFLSTHMLARGPCAVIWMDGRASWTGRWQALSHRQD